jgi:hypothetical protein
MKIISHDECLRVSVGLVAPYHEPVRQRLHSFHAVCIHIELGELPAPARSHMKRLETQIYPRIVVDMSASLQDTSELMKNALHSRRVYV